MGAFDMKKYLLQISLFFAIVAVVDFAAGKVFRYVQANRAGGRTGAEWYACRESNEDIIIMGSSRASHHYVPQIISDSLGMSCFNAGQDGNGIILQYGRWKMISERYAPKLLIYDVTPGFDLQENDNMAYVDRLKPFCDDSEVKDYVAEIFPIERWKLYSQMYRYNYKFLEMLSDCAKTNDDKLKGYIPLYGQIRKEVVEGASNAKAKPIEFDETKLKYLECLVLECQAKNTQLIFVVSPYFKGGSYNEESFSPISDIATKYGLQFYYLNESEFTDNPNLFKDSHHLNDEGAKAFTAELIHRIAS
jgi:hypothetical protein